jgi:hypothetical protein
VLEVMKMEHPIAAERAGSITSIQVSVGDAVDPGGVLVSFEPDMGGGAPRTMEAKPDLTALDVVMQRHALTMDEARPDAVSARHGRGRRTVRENLADLCTDFVEYGPLAVAAQSSRRAVDDLIRNTPADGMVGGVGRIDTGTEGDDRVVVVSYDYTVLAGTQGGAQPSQEGPFVRSRRRHRSSRGPLCRGRRGPAR